MGNPRAQTRTHTLPTTNRVTHGRNPWAESTTHTLPIRVGCPWAMGRIAGLTAVYIPFLD